MGRVVTIAARLVIAIGMLTLLGGFLLRGSWSGSVSGTLSSLASTSSNVKNLTIHSASLNKDMHVDVYLPANYSSSMHYPVLYVLHGKDGNEHSWMNGFFGINGLKINDRADELLAQKKISPVIIVSPEIDNSYGVNSSPVVTSTYGFDLGMYEDYLMNEMIPYIDTHYSTVNAREGRYIAGISMGGFAALHLAFVHPDMFSKVAGYSAALWTNDSPPGINLTWVYPNATVRKDSDPLILARERNLKPIQVVLDHGDADHDWIQQSNHVLYDELKASGVPVQYHIGQGGHDYGYWASRMNDCLLFFAGKQ